MDLTTNYFSLFGLPVAFALDADSILQRDSLLRVVQPFLEDERTIAAIMRVPINPNPTRLCTGICRIHGNDRWVHGREFPDAEICITDDAEEYDDYRHHDA